MITDPRLSASSRNESSFPTEMPLIESVGAAYRQSPPITSKICGFVPQEHQDWDAF